VTLRIVGRTLFGIEVGHDLERIRRSSPVLNDHFRSRLYTLLTLLPDWVPTRGNLRYQAAKRDVEELVLRIIGERRASGEPGDDLLGMLLAARDESGHGMDDHQLRDEVMTLLLAGHDTTALALTWAWVLLSHTPAAAARLYAEIDTVLGRRAPEAADVPRLRYLKQVVAETLRLYPSAWVIGREAVRNTTIGGQPIGKGTTVLLSPWVIHRDRRWFDEPDAFRPERWADGLAQRLPRFAYLPFGGGQRMCIGSGFAQCEVTLVLATIAQRFHVELAEPTRPVDPLPVLTLQPRDSPVVTLRRR
jgi:cytochrome P450